MKKWKIFDFLKRRHDLKLAIIERERTQATKERLSLIRQHEKEMLRQKEELKKEFDKQLSESLEAKDNQIRDLKKLIRFIKNSSENIQILSNEFEIELKSLLVILGKMQNRFGNIEHRAYRETQKLEKKVDRFLQEDPV